ncbi:permease [Brevundimonas sp. Leaf363]|nr:permease [Brevundimonas sp. Leaf363]
MTLIQRYLLRQIALPVVAACAALAGIGLLSQSLDQLQLIVERGQSLGVMAKLTLLALPQLLSVILPIGLFVGALISLTRLQREQELTAIFASGVGRWSAILPAGVLAGAATALGLLTTLVLQPWAQHEARQQAFEIRTDLAALLVEEGSFVQGPEGLTVYVQKVEQNGLLKNLFVYLDNGKTVTTWDADEARFGHADGVPVLRMGHGSMQRYSKNGVLEYFSFDSNTFSLAPFTQSDQRIRYKPSDLFPSELFNPSPGLIKDVAPQNELRAEGHSRITSPLYALAAMALALTAILGGGYSRTGYSARIAKAAGVFLVLRVVGYGVTAASAWNGWMNILQYLLPLAATALALWALFRQLKPRHSRLRPLIRTVRSKFA